METKAKLIIVDDHVLFREGMKLLIETEGLGVVIAEAENGQAFLNLLKDHHPDLVLMDIEMPVMDGLQATIKAKTIRPDLKILALTMLGDRDNYSSIVHAGAMGFVLKTSGKQELEKAIKTLLNGECFFSADILHQIIINSGKLKSVTTVSKENTIEFTEKEIETLKYLCKGLTPTEIAEKLFRSVKTIEVYRSILLEKTKTKNTINLVLFAIKNKLVDIS